jgi:uncharacterized protein (DUF427 family)
MDETPKRISRTASMELMPQRVEALHAGHIVADSAHAVLVREAGQPDLYFFPRQDVEMEALIPTAHRTQSGFGEARYWSLNRDAQIHENGAWSYEHPEHGCEEIADMVAFAPSVVNIHIVDPERDRMWKAEAERMGDYIRHTDSGSGSSQQEHWAPNVFVPRVSR